MDKMEFSQIRKRLGKTQRQMAYLLGLSSKAVQSFEQGWRNIPLYVERQVLFLVAQKQFQEERKRPCWAIEKCPMDRRRNCPAWEFRAGELCWFMNGTVCRGKAQVSWPKKMEICRQCKVFEPILSFISE